MDISDSEQSRSEIDDVEPQDLFNDEAEEDMLSAKENDNKEKSDKQFKEEAKTKAEEKPKFRKQKTERPGINYKTLSKPSGLPELKKLFTGFKFKGNGHEEEDLTRIMGILQHWMCYRLCPSYEFESCMLQLETVGKKRIVQTMMKKYRMGIEDWGDIQPNNENNKKKSDNMEVCEPTEENEFDRLLNEEIANIDSEGELSPAGDNFEAQQSIQKQADITAAHEEFDTLQSTQNKNEGLPTPEQLVTQQRMEKEVEVTLTPEQLERIALNRKLAEEKKRKRMSQQEVTTSKETVPVIDSENVPMQLDDNT